MIFTFFSIKKSSITDYGNHPGNTYGENTRKYPEIPEIPMAMDQAMVTLRDYSN